MYCIRCGCKLKPGNAKCSNCGKDNSQVEYCGGFWGLVGENKALIQNHPNNSDNQTAIGAAAKSGKATKKKKSQKRILTFFVIGLAVLVLFGMIQTLRVNSYSKKNEGLRALYEALQSQYTDLKDEYNTLNSEYQFLQQEMEELNEEIENEDETDQERLKDQDCEEDSESDSRIDLDNNKHIPHLYAPNDVEDIFQNKQRGSQRK